MTARNEKSSVAAYSILASLLMIAGKGTIGIITGSLAILTDALHSFLDLGASIITFFAVRFSEKPADRDHHFGHGKVESLAALVQVALLIVTCGWILYEAFQRLQIEYSEVELSIWAYVVVLGSIAIDISRVRVLRRTAKKYSSQALEADALNFATDIFSSLVVLVGLVAINLGIDWADPAAAIAVTVFILSAVGRMAKKSIDVLLDRAPREAERSIISVINSYREILHIDDLRLRSDGRTIFAVLLLGVDKSMSFARASELKQEIITRLNRALPAVDVTLSFSPTLDNSEDIATSVRYIVSSFDMSLHHLIVKPEDEGYFVSMHIEMPGDVTLHSAHEQATEITHKLHDTIPELKKVVIHPEPYEESCRIVDNDTDIDIDRVASKVKRIIESFPGVEDCHNIVLIRHANGLALSADMRLDGSLPLETTHETSEQVEQKLKFEIQELVSVTLHLEPIK
jgi:cation diffusion facilitator family transporter